MKNSNHDVISDSMAIQKGGQNCSITSFALHISINSSNFVRTGRFSSTDQKQSLWTSLLSDYAWPNINIKINGKRFSGLLDTGSDITIISKHLWPKSWAIQKVSCKLQKFLKSKYKKFIKIFKSTHMKDQKANLQH